MVTCLVRIQGDLLALAARFLDVSGLSRCDHVGAMEPLTLIIETPIGIVTRTVPNASPLREDDPPGTSAEAAVRDAAAVWGLPDFVYRGQRERVGSGSRELGDGLLVIGDVGVVVQVKCREAPGANPERERKWIQKNVAAALQQADGTVRRLKTGPRQLTNARGRRVTVDGTATRWICVVVVDHPSPPDDVLPDITAKTPAVAMLRRDWEFLFDQLKSTHAVVGYLSRAARESVVLGEEPVRYYSLASADHTTEPRPVDPTLLTLNENARTFSTPTLPLRRVPGFEARENLLVRAVFEDIATSRMTRGDDESGRLRVLAELDRLPVGDRGMIGEFLMSSLELVTQTPTGILWRFRRIVTSAPELGRPLNLGFGACSGSEDVYREMFAYWVQLRHYELQERIGHDPEFMSVGVLLTPRRDGDGEWDTSLSAVSGRIDFTRDEYAALSEIWKFTK